MIARTLENLGWIGAFVGAVACGDSGSAPEGGSGPAGGASAQGAGGAGEAGGSGGAPSFPPPCDASAPAPVAGGECTTEDFACDAVSTMTGCGLARFRCCGGRWREKEACDGAEVAPNQPSCDAI